MEVYTTEEQQVEAIKKWFQKYGNMLSWGVIIIAFIASAIMYWRHHQKVEHDAASDHYMALLEGLEKNDKETINSKAETLIKEYSTSPYASLAEFVVAHQAISDNNIAKAEEKLKWIMEKSTLQNFQDIARIRLMRLYISQNKLDEALKYYSDKKGPYLTLMAELKGDVLVQKKDIEGAKQAYALALSSTPEEGMHGPLLKMKMQELGLESKAIDVKADEAGKL